MPRHAAMPRAAQRDYAMSGWRAERHLLLVARAGC